jgi:hypothetical protein
VCQKAELVENSQVEDFLATMELPFAVESTSNSVPPSGANIGGVGVGIGIGESHTNVNNHNASSSSSSLQQSESSLVTASSQGSFMNASNYQHHDQDHHRHHHLDSPLPPNTPQDVVLPARYGNNSTANSMVEQLPRHQQDHPLHHPQQQIRQGQLVVNPPDHDSVKDCGYNAVGDSNHPDDDFAYVNVTEMDADEVDILLEGADVALIPNEPQKGDILAVLLSGMQQCESDALVVSHPAGRSSCFLLCCCVFDPYQFYLHLSWRFEMRNVSSWLRLTKRQFHVL